MNKQEILVLKGVFELNEISISEMFQIACGDAYTVKIKSDVSPNVQCKHRAKELAFPITCLHLDLIEFLINLS